MSHLPAVFNNVNMLLDSRTRSNSLTRILPCFALICVCLLGVCGDFWPCVAFGVHVSQSCVHRLKSGEICCALSIVVLLSIALFSAIKVIMSFYVVSFASLLC